MIFEDLSASFYLFYKIYFLKAIFTLWKICWSLWYITRDQGTLLDLHGHPNGPVHGPCEADLRGPFVKKGAPGSFHGPNWSFFYTDLLTTDKLNFTAWFEVNPTFGSGMISY